MPLFARLHGALRVLCGLLFALLMAAVMLQVTTRLMLPRPPVWTEEFSRFMLILITAFGAGLALRSGELVGVDLLTGGLSKRGRAAAEIAGMAIVIGFCVLLVPPGLDFVDIGGIQTSPALQWNMFWMHCAVVIAPVTLALACIERAVSLLPVLRGEG
jgi:TRAP-type C4-dicarboxylate transport system permease small subunit